jgi:hypothetical protein
MLSPEYAKIVDEMFNIWLVAMFCLLCAGSILGLIKAFWMMAFDMNKKSKRRIF